MKRRGQTEILGLLVIVVLFVVILTFYLSFSLKPQPKSALKQSIQANYINDAILKYTPPCGEEVIKSIRDIIKECDFQANNQICGRPCKTLLLEESKSIIGLADSRYGYSFKIKKTKNNKDSIIDVIKCNGDGITDNQIIYGAEINLKICLLNK